MADSRWPTAAHSPASDRGGRRRAGGRSASPGPTSRSAQPPASAAGVSSTVYLERTGASFVRPILPTRPASWPAKTLRLATASAARYDGCFLGPERGPPAGGAPRAVVVFLIVTGGGAGAEAGSR